MTLSLLVTSFHEEASTGAVEGPTGELAGAG